MKMLEKIQRGLKDCGDTLASLVKIVLMSRRPSPRSRDEKGTVIVMGNGPSLRTAMEEDM